ncbi:nucleotidyltransferase family protein [Cryptosporangium phraense]|uniref:Nucleotidyltransferase family protein n=1 Tax=Cryptosporangium phraense TaxID=2593070 RepID=A0A545AR04_9ACTN|nr:nucleotidyltransferase family protein [Cryptosporangium phraense]TQS43135.1 nucleotidyltransferase family protein [Cryptosporangium phraense]
MADVVDGGVVGGGVVGIVLAAGAGRRFGRPKALVSFRGVRLVDRAVALLRDGGCSPILVVAGAAPLTVAGATVVDNPGWDEGMGSSVRAALAVAEGGAAVLVPVDTPYLGPDAVRRLISAYRDGATVAVATYGGKRGHPVLIAAEHWPAVRETAVGDVGARAFLAAHRELITPVPCDDTGRPDDVDTPDALV